MSAASMPQPCSALGARTAPPPPPVHSLAQAAPLHRPLRHAALERFGRAASRELAATSERAQTQDRATAHCWRHPALHMGRPGTCVEIGVAEPRRHGREGGKSLVAGPQPGAGATSPLPFQASAAAKRKAKGTATTEEGTPDDGIDPTDRIPTKYWSLDSLSPTPIGQYLLSACEPASMSVRNLKAINIKGQALQNSRMQVLEQAPSDGQGEERDARQKGAGADPPIRLHRAVQRLVLALHGVRRGVFVCEAQFHRSEESVQSRRSPPFKGPGCLFIDNNFSELRAALASKRDENRRSEVILFPHFPKQEVISMLAIADGRGADDQPEDGCDLDPNDFVTPPPTRRKRSVSNFVGSLAGQAKEQRRKRKA